MLKIENGRFSECTFLDDIVNKNISLNRYRDQACEVKGLIVGFSTIENIQKIWVDVDEWPNITASYNLHNIEFAEIF